MSNVIDNVIDNVLDTLMYHLFMTISQHQRVTMADVAKHAGVSVATVSKVVNNRYGVSAETLERVQKVITELGFHTSLGAQSLRGGRTGVLGILLAEFEPFSTEILKGASAQVSGTEYELLAYSGRSNPNEVGWERRHLARLSGGVIDGAVLITPSVSAPVSNFPLVAVDPNIGDTRIPKIISDNYTGAREATEYLLRLGHRRIGFLGGRSDLDSAAQRELGFRDTLKNAGITPDESLIVSGDFRPAGAVLATEALLGHANRPTAIFAANDSMALQAIDFARRMNLRVPEDISVIGFDNIPEAASSAIPLTTVSQPMQMMGKEAVRVMVDLLAGRTTPLEIKLPTELKVRASCGPVPN